MKKILFLFIPCIFLLLSLSACSEQTNTTRSSDDEYEFYEPVFDKESMTHLGESVGIEMDENYNNVVASAENDLITTTSVIECRVTNQNIGKGFSLYSGMAIDKKTISDKWVRLKYKPREYTDWFVVGLKETKETCYSSVVRMDLNDVQEELTPGDYRLVIFIGERNLYVEVKIYPSKQRQEAS